MGKTKPTTLAGRLTRWRQTFEDFLQEEVAGRPLINKLRLPVHFFWLVWRGFSGNRCPVRAAALAYTTLLALVPLLAVVLSVTKNFLQDSSADLVPQLMNKLVTNIAPALEVSAAAKEQTVGQIQAFIGNINAGALGTIGTLLLVVVGIRLLVDIEQTFNDVWGVEQGRSIWRKVVYYWTTITLGPLALLFAMYLTGRAEVAALVNKFNSVPWLDTALWRLAPFVVLWVGFAFLYALMPNTRVRPQAALCGAVFAGTLWQLNNLLSTLYISRVVTYSKIYGALGAIPVFLVGLYFSWLIVLLGAQVSYAAQNVRAFMQQRAGERIDQRQRELIACRVVLLACQQFLRGAPPVSVGEAAERCHAPFQWLNHLVARLVAGGVLTEISNDQPGLQPARPPESITIADVLHVVRTRAGRCGEPEWNAAAEPVARVLAQLDTATRAHPANVTFRDLAASAPESNQT